MKWLLFSLVILTLTTHAGPPVVTNVVAVQRANTKLVDIRYDVSDAENDLVKIRIEISHNGGSTYAVPALSLSGDIGAGITPGPNKLIVWNAGIDWDGEFSEAMRVKVIASDGKGFPGMEWGQEVPPGGFFMGQDGGPEGVGPGRHVNIPWSYWLSKYEVTVEQFNEFLNTALGSGLVRLNGGVPLAVAGAFTGIPAGSSVGPSGESDIQWNLNRFAVVAGRERLPVIVNFYGALAFAVHYGYDLPTEAEWEKAARGPDHDGLGEHWIYPWGNAISTMNGSFGGRGRSRVGLFSGTDSPSGFDMANAYGLYDIIGNAAEWTRTSSGQIEEYPAIESLNNSIHAYGGGTVITRGGSYQHNTSDSALRCHSRGYSGYPTGIRLVRRAQP